MTLGRHSSDGRHAHAVQMMLRRAAAAHHASAYPSAPPVPSRSSKAKASSSSTPELSATPARRRSMATCWMSGWTEPKTHRTERFRGRSRSPTAKAIESQKSEHAVARAITLRSRWGPRRAARKNFVLSKSGPPINTLRACPASTPYQLVHLVAESAVHGWYW